MEEEKYQFYFARLLTARSLSSTNEISKAEGKFDIVWTGN